MTDTTVIRETDGHALSTSRILDDVLDDLVWMMTHQEAIVTMSKPVLRALLEAYGRDLEREGAA